MHPILFEIPGLNIPVYSYGVMLGLSIVVGWYLVTYLAKKDGLPAEKITVCFVWTVIVALLGARLLFIFTNLDAYFENGFGELLNVRKGGLVAYGGFIGGFIGSWIYLKRQGIRLLPWADAVVPALGTGLGITRVGCYLYGCDYGKPIADSAPGWIKTIGLRFPNWGYEIDLSDKVHQPEMYRGAPAFLHHVHDGLVNFNDATSALVYPTQLMEVANGWIAFALTMMVRKRTKFRGQAFLFFTAYYGITRTLMEIIRGDTQRGGVGFLSTSQIVGLATFTAAAVAWYVLAKRAQIDPVAAMSLVSKR